MKSNNDLIQAHKELKAEFEPYWEWEMPASYGDIGKEIFAVRNQAGLIDLTFLGVLKVYGKESVRFLQGLLTNDVESLLKNRGMQAAFLTGHGKVRAFCVVLHLGVDYLIINDPQTHGKIFNYIFPFSYAGDFFVEDVSVQFQTISLQGPNSILILKEVCFEPIQQLGDFEWQENSIAGQQVIILKRSHTGELGFDILVSNQTVKDVWDFMLIKGKYHGLIPVGLKALDTLRIEAAMPVYGVDIDEGNMFLEAGIENAVSFTKGCYTGQEAVAMATYRGHVSKKLSAILFDETATIEKGNHISKDGKEIGILSSVAHSEHLKKKVGLACIKYGFFEDGKEVEVITESGPIAGRVTKSPLKK